MAELEEFTTQQTSRSAAASTNAIRPERHHYTLCWRFGEHAIVERRLGRENLTPFERQTHLPRRPTQVDQDTSNPLDLEVWRSERQRMREDDARYSQGFAEAAGYGGGEDGESDEVCSGEESESSSNEVEG